MSVVHDVYWLDKVRVRASFDRAADTYDAAAVLQAEVRARMLDRLDFVKVAPQAILDAGCGTGRVNTALERRFNNSRIVSLDIAMGMLRKVRASQSATQVIRRVFGLSQQSLLCGDIENLPLADSSIGLVWSNLALQWCNDMDLAFREAYRVLEPEGLIMFSTFGPDTLKELRQAANTDPEHVHVSRFIDMHDIGDALIRAGFSAPVLDVEQFVLTYDDAISVMRDLKAIGAHNAADGRSKGLQGKGFLKKLIEHYERFRSEGKLPATFEVVYGHAWKPAFKPELEDGAVAMTFMPRNKS
jgi:malonyl-CoA O-methyltransferase